MTRPNKVLRTIDAYSVVVLSDGDTTQAEINARGPYANLLTIGEGESRRAPGDSRNDAIGELLALARAFEDAAAHARRELTALGYNNVQG